MRHSIVSFVRTRGPPRPRSQTKREERAHAGLLLNSAPVRKRPAEKIVKALTFGVTRLSEPFENQTRLLASDPAKSL